MDHGAGAGHRRAQGHRHHAARELLAVAGEGRCELCEAQRCTTWYHEDEECWVADCEICDTPMVVWRTHAPDPPGEVVARLLAALRAVADARLGHGAYVVDDRMRNIPDHYHAHARSLGRSWTSPPR